MAILKCPNCGSDITDKAIACKYCAYPWKNFSPIHCTTVKFETVTRNDIDVNCYVYDKNYKKMANCKLGEKANFICCEPYEVVIQMAGCICKPSFTVSAGKCYLVRMIRFGLVSVEEI